MWGELWGREGVRGRRGEARQGQGRGEAPRMPTRWVCGSPAPDAPGPSTAANLQGGSTGDPKTPNPLTQDSQTLGPAARPTCRACSTSGVPATCPTRPSSTCRIVAASLRPSPWRACTCKGGAGASAKHACAAWGLARAGWGAPHRGSPRLLTPSRRHPRQTQHQIRSGPGASRQDERISRPGTAAGRGCPCPPTLEPNSTRNKS